MIYSAKKLLDSIMFVIGDIFHSPELLIPGVADTTNLAPVYDLVGNNIQHYSNGILVTILVIVCNSSIWRFVSMTPVTGIIYMQWPVVYT